MNNELLQSLIGQWQGACRTWFSPGDPDDEADIQGRFRQIVGGQFVRHEYESQMQGKPRTGEETIVLNSIKQRFEVAWIDDFHMNYAIMFSQGESTEHGFTVAGHYDVAPGQPAWGWKTVYELHDADHLTITAYNVSPNGEEAKAVETKYTRVKR